jgi:ribosomal protein L25 (general stress protein Ctc)
MNTEQIILNVEKRDTSEKNDELRNAGIVPAVLYGPDEENTLIKVNRAQFERV